MAQKKVQQPSGELVIRNLHSGFTTAIPREQFEAHCPRFRARWEILSGGIAPADAPQAPVAPEPADEASEDAGE